MDELRTLIGGLTVVGSDAAVLNDPRVAHVVASGHRVLGHHAIPGVFLEAEETPDAIVGRITIREGTAIESPIHLCFGLVHQVGMQRIKMDVKLEPHSSAVFLAHCLFLNVEQAEHVMDAVVDIGEGASLTYHERHYHGLSGGIRVAPHLVASIRKAGRYFSDFSLTTGRVGILAIDYTVEAEGGAVTELTAKVFGRSTDEITIREKVVLAGEYSRGLIKTRVALEDSARAEVTGITEAHAKGARGHVDCMEIIKDRAVASAVPIVKVSHPEAKVTHEAAIGSVDKKELETLMAHGLTPEQAVELIVSGILQ